LLREKKGQLKEKRQNCEPNHRESAQSKGKIKRRRGQGGRQVCGGQGGSTAFQGLPLRKNTVLQKRGGGKSGEGKMLGKRESRRAGKNMSQVIFARERKKIFKKKRGGKKRRTRLASHVA